MAELIWIMPALPLLGFAILAVAGTRLGRGAVGAIGVGSVGLSAVAAVAAAIGVATTGDAGGAISRSLWTWIQVDDLSVDMGLRLDPLSAVMTLVITGVGFLIHLYSAEFMQEDDGYARYFAYLNLFVAAMLILVLGDNLVALFLGWEGVGLCSYLLIGFWYRDPANGRAARKAFVVTRIGDVALVVAVFLFFFVFAELEIQPLLQSIKTQWPAGHPLATTAATLVLLGAIGKSAQLPLQVWLPDAMAGPSPVSALIHAATMVTAGVYLIARLHPLFETAPGVLFAVAVIGALTMLIAGLSALAARDIKRSLAYSTISQVGYMFLALGVGAWSAAIFHLVTHAFFKALLFLGAGVVIASVHHEHDMFKMGGLRRHDRTTFWTFTVGAASLASLPLVTAGFYSKEQILWLVWASPKGGPVLWAAGVIGAFITAVYAFRMVFLTFFGPVHTEPHGRPGPAIKGPLVILAVLAVVAGFMELPHNVAAVHTVSDFLHPALPTLEAHGSEAAAWGLQGVAVIASLGGLAVAYLAYERFRDTFFPRWENAPGWQIPATWARGGFGFDTLYRNVVVRPFGNLAHALRHEPVDAVVRGIVSGGRHAYIALNSTQTGELRWYVASLVGGTVVVMGALFFL